MMKKLVFFVFILFLLYLIIPSKGMFQQASVDNGYQEIPDDAIRLRILANSDDDDDQQVKRDVRDAVNEKIGGWVQDIDDIAKARKLIQKKLPEIEDTVEKTLNDKGISQSFDVDYNDSVSFPTKVYGDYFYPAGKYEAVLITLGKGEGANWWCVLFPPLCFLDFSDGSTVADASDSSNHDTNQAEAKPADQDEEKDVKVKFFLLEWLGLS